jgi:hypothetical protein
MSDEMSDSFDRYKCRCGSGKPKYALHDARGIFCTYYCDDCETEKRSKYREDIFTDSNYWHDEPIDEDY